jgi:hypothetical protein
MHALLAKKVAPFWRLARLVHCFASATRHAIHSQHVLVSLCALRGVRTGAAKTLCALRRFEQQRIFLSADGVG